MRTEVLEALITIAISSFLGAMVWYQIYSIDAITELWWLVVVVVLIGVVGGILILTIDKLTLSKKRADEQANTELTQMS